MSHFYGVLQGGRGRSTRCGTKSSGITATAASWAGAIEVTLERDNETGRDIYTVRKTPWRGAGESAILAKVYVGKETP